MGDRENVRAFYSVATAEQYKVMMQSEDELKHYRADVAELAKIVVPGQPVLDVGCGCGDLLNLVHTVNPDLKLVGIDVAETMLTHARALLPSATFAIDDATSITSVADSSIGALLCTFVTHHLEDEEFHCAVNEFARVLSIGAPVYHVYWLGEGEMEGFAELSDKPPPLLKRTEKFVDAAFAAAGLRKASGRVDTSYEWGYMGFATYCK